MTKYQLLHGDCLNKLKELEDNSVDAIVTDPPYGLSFMSKKWDYDVPSQEIWEECFRVLKQGGHLLSFSGSRTYHRMAVRIEDAGFEIRDQIMWIYGSGFPKSYNIGKAVDKKLGNERDIVGNNPNHRESDSLFELGFHGGKGNGKITKGNSEWEGWGTALKPAHEPIVMARKPFKGSVADNVLEHGVGAINIDGCRIATDETLGRFPANVIFDEEAGKILDEQSDKASRFFYCPKTNKKDRNEGLEDFEEKIIEGRDEGQDKRPVAFKLRPSQRKNIHPTVKPTDLMAYLIRLVTRKGGVVLDPFMGSGSTGKACAVEGMQFIGIEREQEYLDIAKARIEHAYNPINPTLF